MRAQLMRNLPLREAIGDTENLGQTRAAVTQHSTWQETRNAIATKPPVISLRFKHRRATQKVTAMKNESAKCGHVKRRLLRNEPLTGRRLRFALDVLNKDGNSSNEAFLTGISRKLQSGEQLTEYECHFMVDVVLLHNRLGAALTSPSDPCSGDAAQHHRQRHG